MQNKMNYPLPIQFTQGQLGFHQNKTNPYKVDTPAYKEWERGYNSEYFENLKNV